MGQKIKIDFTTTAMARPEILDRTYASFSKYLTNINMKECRLFINIDPLPKKGNRKEVVQVAKKYFKTVHAHFPRKANHPKACNWIWSQASTDYIFNLEDDWVMTREVSFLKMLKQIDKVYSNKTLKTPNELLAVILRAYSYKYPRFPLSPSIMSKLLYKSLAGNLNPKENAECQLRGKISGLEMPRKHTARKLILVYPQKPHKIVVKDIGRKWLEESNYENKYKQKKELITWTKKEKKL